MFLRYKSSLVRAAEDDNGGGTPTPPAAMPTPTPQESQAGTEGEQNVSQEPKEAGGNEPPASEPKAAPKPNKKDWRETRIGEISARNRILEKQIQEREAELERLRQTSQVPVGGQQQQQAGQQQFQPPAQQTSQEEIQRLARIEAANMEFTRQCNQAVAKGKSEFPDFESRMSEFTHIGGLPPALVEAAFELEQDNDDIKAHSLLYNLAGDLNEAMRIRDLSPSRMGAALAKLANSGPKRQPSNAPDPVGRNLRGPAAVPPKDPDQMTTAEWMKWREATQQSRRPR